jgi:hypothetical protein
MSAQQDFFRLIDAGGQVRRAPVVGVELLHQRPIRLSDLVEARTRLKPQDLVGFLFRHYARMRMGARPRVAITLSVFTPAGKPAVKIRL